MASTFKDWVIINHHTGHEIPFQGDIEAAILKAKDVCKIVGDRYTVLDTSMRDRMAAKVSLMGWKGGAWFSVFVQPYYRDRIAS